MKKKLERILNSGKRILAGAGLISLLSMPMAVGCGSDNGDDGGSNGGNNGYQPTYYNYNCQCEGDGLFTTMKVNNATSKYDAESFATNKCRGDYPETGCYCDCVKAGSSSNGNCTPNCSGKQCGDDGCGGNCGNCGSDEYCNGGRCKPEESNCVPDCSNPQNSKYDKECGNNGCGGSCGTCSNGEDCIGGFCFNF